HRISQVRDSGTSFSTARTLISKPRRLRSTHTLLPGRSIADGSTRRLTLRRHSSPGTRLQPKLTRKARSREHASEPEWLSTRHFIIIARQAFSRRTVTGRLFWRVPRSCLY